MVFSVGYSQQSLRAGRTPHERRAASANVLDRGAVGAVDDCDPVADDRARDLVERLEQPAAQIGERRAAARNVKAALPFRDDARRRPALVELSELAREEIVEAERIECRQAEPWW